MKAAIIPPGQAQTYLYLMVLWAVLGIITGFVFSWGIAAAWFVSGIVIPKIEMKPRVDVQWTKE